MGINGMVGVNRASGPRQAVSDLTNQVALNRQVESGLLGDLQTANFESKSRQRPLARNLKGMGQGLNIKA